MSLEEIPNVTENRTMAHVNEPDSITIIRCLNCRRTFTEPVDYVDHPCKGRKNI